MAFDSPFARAAVFIGLALALVGLGFPVVFQQAPAWVGYLLIGGGVLSGLYGIAIVLRALVDRRRARSRLQAAVTPEEQRALVADRVRIEELPGHKGRHGGEAGNPYFDAFDVHNESPTDITMSRVSYRLLDESEIPLETVAWQRGEEFGTHGRVVVRKSEIGRDGGISRIEVRTMLPVGTRIKVDGSAKFESDYGSFTIPVSGRYFDIT